MLQAYEKVLLAPWIIALSGAQGLQRSSRLCNLSNVNEHVNLPKSLHFPASGKQHVVSGCGVALTDGYENLHAIMQHVNSPSPLDADRSCNIFHGQAF